MKTESEKYKLKSQPSINSKTFVRRPLLQRAISKLLLLFLLASCQTSQKRFQNETQGQWNAKALVKNTLTNKSQVVVLDINAIKDQKLRLDITNPAGLFLASLVLVGDEAQYIIPSQKKYFKGKADANVLKNLVGFSLDVRLVYNILFDQEISNKNWVCTTNDVGAVLSCESVMGSMKIIWDSTGAGKKLVKVEAKNTELQLLFNKFERKLKSSDSLFSLKVPESFRRSR